MTQTIAQHEWNDIGWCVHCGCASWERVREWHQKRGDLHKLPAEDTRGCDPRRLVVLAPEPRRRDLAHEDAEAIGKRLLELKADRDFAAIVQACAHHAGRPQAECGQCNDPARDCLVCAMKRNKPPKECAICPLPSGGFGRCPSRA